MPRKSLLLLLPISFFLIVAPLARGDSLSSREFNPKRLAAIAE